MAQLSLVGGLSSSHGTTESISTLASLPFECFSLCIRGLSLRDSFSVCSTCQQLWHFFSHVISLQLDSAKKPPPLARIFNRFTALRSLTLRASVDWVAQNLLSRPHEALQNMSEFLWLSPASSSAPAIPAPFPRFAPFMRTFPQLRRFMWSHSLPGPIETPVPEPLVFEWPFLVRLCLLIPPLRAASSSPMTVQCPCLRWLHTNHPRLVVGPLGLATVHTLIYLPTEAHEARPPPAAPPAPPPPLVAAAAPAAPPPRPPVGPSLTLRLGGPDEAGAPSPAVLPALRHLVFCPTVRLRLQRTRPHPDEAEVPPEAREAAAVARGGEDLDEVLTFGELLARMGASLHSLVLANATEGLSTGDEHWATGRPLAPPGPGAAEDEAARPPLWMRVLGACAPALRSLVVLPSPGGRCNLTGLRLARLAYLHLGVLPPVASALWTAISMPPRSSLLRLSEGCEQCGDEGPSGSACGWEAAFPRFWCRAPQDALGDADEMERAADDCSADPQPPDPTGCCTVALGGTTWLPALAELGLCGCRIEVIGMAPAAPPPPGGPQLLSPVLHPLGRLRHLRLQGCSFAGGEAAPCGGLLDLVGTLGCHQSLVSLQAAGLPLGGARMLLPALRRVVLAQCPSFAGPRALEAARDCMCCMSGAESFSLAGCPGLGTLRLRTPATLRALRLADCPLLGEVLLEHIAPASACPLAELALVRCPRLQVVARLTSQPTRPNAASFPALRRLEVRGCPMTAPNLAHLLAGAPSLETFEWAASASAAQPSQPQGSQEGEEGAGPRGAFPVPFPRLWIGHDSGAPHLALPQQPSSLPAEGPSGFFRLAGLRHLDMDPWALVCLREVVLDTPFLEGTLALAGGPGVPLQLQRVAVASARLRVVCLSQLATLSAVELRCPAVERLALLSLGTLGWLVVGCPMASCHTVDISGCPLLGPLLSGPTYLLPAAPAPGPPPFRLGVFFPRALRLSLPPWPCGPLFDELRTLPQLLFLSAPHLLADPSAPLLRRDDLPRPLPHPAAPTSGSPPACPPRDGRPTTMELLPGPALCHPAIRELVLPLCPGPVCCPQLRALALTGAQCSTAEQLTQALRPHRNLVRLRLVQPPRLDAPTLGAIFGSFGPTLVSLTIAGSRFLGDEECRLLTRNCPMLEALQLTNLGRLVRPRFDPLPCLVALDLSRCAGLQDPTGALEACPALETLCLSHCRLLSPSGLRAVEQLRRLRDLAVRGATARVPVSSANRIARLCAGLRTFELDIESLCHDPSPQSHHFHYHLSLRLRQLSGLAEVCNQRDGYWDEPATERPPAAS
ncbi:hypothetical protein PAPYR_1860 [Paratrimastix pyriformis]|uniref:Uncharacterized protein n=1 Tax=Paratrimastix pyriformis TaxID=342808 RepID=A0ABQ8URG0_9EUKA|nr:hypothetical protein PAPYR_1860 [Paratrimastix pyriformis]